MAIKTHLQPLSTIVVKPVDWLFYPYIPYGKVTVIQGDTCSGKTALALDIAMRVSRGLPMPESDRPTSKGHVIYQNVEDGYADTIKQRLDNAGADCDCISFINDPDQALRLDSPELLYHVKESSAKLLIIDPIQGFCANRDMNRANDIRPLMRSLSNMADETGCAVVLIGHMNKAARMKMLYRGLGSIDFVSAARSVLLVTRQSTESSLRVMAQLKNNLTQQGESLAFEITDEGCIDWQGEIDTTVDNLLCGDKQSKGKMACDIITELLKIGPVHSQAIFDACSEMGIGKRTVNAAKQHLGIKTKRICDQWVWELP